MESSRYLSGLGNDTFITLLNNLSHISIDTREDQRITKHLLKYIILILFKSYQEYLNTFSFIQKNKQIIT